MAIGYGEINAVRDMPSLPKSQLSLHGPGTYQPTRERKLRALESYLAVVKYLLPTDESLLGPCLWHNDLHSSNIFVASDDPTNVTCIIDWQATVIAPLYDQFRTLSLLNHGQPPTEGLERPALVENYEELNMEEKKQAMIEWSLQALDTVYRVFLHDQVPHFYSAMEFQNKHSSRGMVFFRQLLVESETFYLGQILEIEKMWSDLPRVQAAGNPPFPLHFTDEEKKEIEMDAEGGLRAMNAMKNIKKCLDEDDLFPESGLVTHDQYDYALNALDQMKEQVADQFAKNESEREIWYRNWPFDSQKS